MNLLSITPKNRFIKLSTQPYEPFDIGNRVKLEKNKRFGQYKRRLQNFVKQIFGYILIRLKTTNNKL